MHKYTKLLQFFEMFTGNMISNPHGKRMCGYMYNSIFFCMKIYMFWK